MAGRLILCASPIGNLGDAPPRLAESLAGAGVVFAEDTRRARILLDHLGVSPPVRSFFLGNEERRVGEIAERLQAGEVVALLTDAGTPGVADPGLSAVRAAIEVGAEVTGIPGPSAVTLALAMSGAPADRFVFEGFLPRSGGDRSRRIGSIQADARTTVLFCSPNRLAADLADLAEAMPARPCVVCREMTKLHEELWRGTLGEAARHWTDVKVRGEVTLVVFGGEGPPPDLDGALEIARRAIDAGGRPSTVAREVAEATGVSRRALYQAILDRRGGA